jgi:hypothetical protein
MKTIIESSTIAIQRAIVKPTHQGENTVIVRIPKAITLII